MNKVDFFIVGQPKSGTTALAKFLDEHPEICMTVPKEPGYMAKDLMKESDAFHGGKRFFQIRTQADYEKAYAHAKPGQFVGDASTVYLYSRLAAQEIRRYNPDAKVIMMLRNPVDMIYSLYYQYKNELGETADSFQEALAAENDRAKGRRLPKDAYAPSYLQYRKRGSYFEQVERFFKLFDPKNILVITSEEFRKDNAREYKKALKFLGVKDTAFAPEFRGVHESKTPRSKLLHKLAYTRELTQAVRTVLGEQVYTRVQKKVFEPLVLKRSQRKNLQPSVRRELESYFSKDTAKLSRLIHKDLTKIWFGN